MPISPMNQTRNQSQTQTMHQSRKTFIKTGADMISGTPKEASFAVTKKSVVVDNKTVTDEMHKTSKTNRKTVKHMDQTMGSDSLAALNKTALNPAQARDERNSNYNSETSDDGSKVSDAGKMTTKAKGKSTKHHGKSDGKINGYEIAKYKDQISK